MILKIDKKNLDNVIRLEKKYWKTGDTDYLDAQKKYLDYIEDEIKRQTKIAHHYFWGICELLSFFARFNFTYQKIYDFLKIVGYEVINNEVKTNDY